LYQHRDAAVRTGGVFVDGNQHLLQFQQLLVLALAERDGRGP
jgi:hypothetical protein